MSPTALEDQQRRINRLFVYGTLGPGRPNEHVLRQVGGHWKEAFVRGRLVHKGWGADLGYPALVLDNAAGEVAGFVFYSENLEQHLNRLDAFEGAEYKRKVAIAQTKDGEALESYIYVLRQGS